MQPNIRYDQTVQDFPLDFNYGNEQERFTEAGNVWKQGAKRGSKKWREILQALAQTGVAFTPTLTAYDANRDLQRAYSNPYFKDYAAPALLKFWKPNYTSHGSFHFDWTTEREVAWKLKYQKWMSFINDYKNIGGRVTVGEDAGFLYNLYGFAYIRELELLQEAGFHPLEVIRAATSEGAGLLGLDDVIGTITIGKEADMIVVTENPLTNFKILYGDGHKRLNLQTGITENIRGIDYTIVGGVPLKVDTLLHEVRDMVSHLKTAQE